MFKHLLCLLASALLMGKAVAAVKEPITILDNFTLGQTNLDAYIAEKSKVCSVTQQRDLYLLPGSCYQSDALISANLRKTGKSVELRFHPQALEEIRVILVSKYGKPKKTEKSGIAVWLLGHYHILLAPASDLQGDTVGLHCWMD